MNESPNQMNLPIRSRRTLLLMGIWGLIAAPLTWALEKLPRPNSAFSADSVAATLRELYGDREIQPSEDIKIQSADLAENGAVVPVKITTELADLRSISLIATKNPVPLIAKFMFAGNAAGFVASRVKLAESSELIAVVETASGCYRTQKTIEVTVGGCGV